MQLIRQSHCESSHSYRCVSVVKRESLNVVAKLLLAWAVDWQSLSYSDFDCRRHSCNFLLQASFQVDCHSIKSRGSRSLSLQNQKKSRSAAAASLQNGFKVGGLQRYELLIHSNRQRRYFPERYFQF